MGREVLEQVERIIVKLKDARDELANAPDSPVDSYFVGKIDEWAAKIAGITNGYDAEFGQMYKHRVLKGRIISDDSGDVTVGAPDDLHAKTIQLKSTLQADASTVSGMIKAALNQLSGERGETPRAGDRLVVDMIIQNHRNTWPGGFGTLGSFDWNAFERKAIEKLHELCSEYRPHRSANKPGAGLSPAAVASLTDVRTAGPTYRVRDIAILGRPSSTQVVSHQLGQHPSNPDKLKHLTIKIRYPRGYPIKSGFDFVKGKDTLRWLHLAAFNVFRVGDDRLSIALVKHMYY